MRASARITLLEHVHRLFLVALAKRVDCGMRWACIRNQRILCISMRFRLIRRSEIRYDCKTRRRRKRRVPKPKHALTRKLCKCRYFCRVCSSMSPQIIMWSWVLISPCFNRCEYIVLHLIKIEVGCVHFISSTCPSAYFVLNAGFIGSTLLVIHEICSHLQYKIAIKLRARRKSKNRLVSDVW